MDPHVENPAQGCQRLNRDKVIVKFTSLSWVVFNFFAYLAQTVLILNFDIEQNELHEGRSHVKKPTGQEHDKHRLVESFFFQPEHSLVAILPEAKYGLNRARNGHKIERRV